MEEVERMESEIAAYGAAAQRHANGFWFMAVVGGVLWYIWSLWAAALPLALAALAIAMSIHCTRRAERVRQLLTFWKARLAAVE